MSCVGLTTGLPSCGFNMLFAASIKKRHSACASTESGTCTAIWSPSKSALYAVQTSGCSFKRLAFHQHRLERLYP